MKCFAILLLTIFVPAVLAQERWTGHYEFEESGGKTAGGTAIVVTHEIEIMKTDDGLVAQITSMGYQTSASLVGKATMTGQKLAIYFESYGEDNIFEPYKEGDLLLTLERKDDKLLTHWGAFKPAIEKYSKSGKVYFQKIRTVEE
jgi:hypothetical protein